MHASIRLSAKLFLVGLVGAACLGAAEPTVSETTRLAKDLDELVRQRGQFHSEFFKNGRPLYVSEPVELERILPIAAEMLKVEKADLRELLEEDRQALSRIVYARLLGAKRNKGWKPLLINGEDLFAALQKEGVSVGQIHQVIENLYVELAFASLDSPVAPRPHSTNAKR